MNTKIESTLRELAARLILSVSEVAKRGEGSSRFLLKRALPLLLATVLVLPGSPNSLAADKLTAEALIKQFTSAESFLQIRLSPDGQRLAAIGYNGVGSGLFLGDVRTLKFELIVPPRWVLTTQHRYMRSPASAHWIDNDLLAVNFDDREAESVDLTGRTVANLGTRYIGRFHRTHEPAGRVVAAYQKDKAPGQSAAGPSAALVDPQTGRRLRWEKFPPGKLLDAVFDDQGILRAVATRNTPSLTERTTVSQWYRSGEQADWQLLEEEPYTSEYWEPLHVPAEPDTLIVQSRRGRDTWAIVRYDTKKRKEVEVMAAHPREDIVRVTGLDGEFFWRVETAGLKPQTHWFHERWAVLQATVDKALPGRVNVLSGDPEGSVLVFSRSDVDPGRWFVFDSVALTIKLVAQVAPHVNVAAMRPMQTMQYTARDGLTIPAYLTLPDATGPQPMVVLIHGGPTHRDQWAWDAEVQLLALQGYAVFQPQFRGSAGFGAAFEQAGYGQWGLSMQDDVTDGVRHLIEKKIADPGRICIYGTSYGGYAALWGLIKTPELFRCGISFAGVTDIDALLAGDSDLSRDPVRRELLMFRLGMAAREGPQFQAVSPLRHADRIQAPVLIAHGGYDYRVPISHGRNMVEALKSGGKVHRWMIFKDEGHGLRYVENRREYYEALLEFLAQHNGPKAPSRAPSRLPSPGIGP